MQVEPSVEMNVLGNKIEYRPCKLFLADGSSRDRVYVMEKTMIMGGWDPHGRGMGERSVAIELVTKIDESPFRIPAKVANKIYAAGESGMGYCLFTLILKDGRALPYVTGNAVDFVDLPPRVAPDLIADVRPHAGREHFQTREMKPYTRGSAFEWCVYEL